MRLGYFTMPLHPPGSDLSATLESDLVQMETLDRLGYCEAWIGEHFTTVWENIPAPDQFIAAALPRTKDIVLRHRRYLHAQPRPLHDRPPGGPVGQPSPGPLLLGRRVRRLPRRL